jgi:hypothetical protein
MGSWLLKKYQRLLKKYSEAPGKIFRSFWKNIQELLEKKYKIISETFK